jgi:hypothetical protein
MNEAKSRDDLLIALDRGSVIPYLGAGMLDLCPEAGAVPASMESLAGFLGSKVTVPGRARGNLSASAQYIENFKHRKTLNDLMAQAFAPQLTPSSLHHALAGLPGLALIVQLWYDDAMRSAIMSHRDVGLIQAASQAEQFGTWFNHLSLEGVSVATDAAAAWSLALYQPWGALVPNGNFLVSDSDFVEVLTEIDIQTPIPALVQERRRGRSFLFLGCRFTSQTERLFAHQIMKRSADTHYAVLNAEPSRNEARFLAQHGIQRLDMSLTEFTDWLQAQGIGPARQSVAAYS